MDDRRGRIGRARALFDEDVIVRMPLVRAAGALARPVLRLNHDLMMRSGRKGLRRLLG